jgi:uncharacterized membrane protein YfcA
MQGWTAVFVVGVFFIATLIRSALGFGEALVAVPLLALVLPVTVAAPVAVLMSITVAAAVVAQDWRHVHIGDALRLVAATVFGIPFGLLLLHLGSETLIKSALGVIVAAFALASIRGREGPHRLVDERFAWPFGFAAGVLGGAYGMNGPPLAMYGALRQWTPGRFRATLQGYFLPASAIGLLGYWIVGLWTRQVTTYYLESLPAAVVAIALGRAVNRRFDARRFFVYVQGGLVASGAALLLQTIIQRHSL